MEEGKISRVVTRAHGLADWLVATLVAERLERAARAVCYECHRQLQHTNIYIL
jgi:hypothetical protein